MTTRKDLRASGEAMRSRLHGAGAGLNAVEGAAHGGDAAPGFRQLMSEAVYGGVWSRPGLPVEDRMICTLAALAAVERMPQLRQQVDAALRVGLEPRGILEVFVQVGLYTGFGAAENASAAAAAVFRERGVALPEDPPREDSLEALDERGAALMRDLHGARGTQGYAAPGNAVTGALYPAAIQYGYGELWFRPGLDRRRRALVVVAAFTALGLEGQAQKFGQSALNVGLDKTAVIEAVIQTAPYSGFPRALNVLSLLSQVF